MSSRRPMGWASGDARRPTLASSGERPPEVRKMQEVVIEVRFAGWRLGQQVGSDLRPVVDEEYREPPFRPQLGMHRSLDDGNDAEIQALPDPVGVDAVAPRADAVAVSSELAEVLDERAGRGRLRLHLGEGCPELRPDLAPWAM